ncbi:AAA ATPase [Mortierella alpina]|nr:AAA ATPase [Mortierella alpina]
MAATFLRKRALSFSEDEDDASHAYPPTPTKRMSGAVFFRQLQTDTRPIASPSFSEALDDSDDNDVDADDSAWSAEKDTTGETHPGAQEQDLEQPAKPSPPLSPSLPTPTAKTSRQTAAITPPRTPTRGSGRVRQQQEAGRAEEDIAPAAESKRATSKTPGGLLTPRTPSKESPAGGAALSSSGSSGSGQVLQERSKQTTGLTPAMNKMFRLTDENSTGVAKARGKKVQDENAQAPGYSTPKRLQRPKSQQNAAVDSTSGAVPAKGEASAGLSTVAPKANSSANPMSTVFQYYQDAKTLFRRTAQPHRLVGRDMEREAIRKFCREHILKTNAGSLYISGQPGTGKTALLNETLRDMEPEMKEEEHEIKTMVVNCMTIKDPRLVYSKLLEEMGIAVESKDKDWAIKALESLVLKSSKKIMYVVVLDEIDQLLTKDQDVLYKLFEWSSMERSKLTLIGIANALDMTDRFLPRLRAKNCEPQLLNFNPYQVAEIRAIIMDRLFSMEGEKDHGKGGEKDEKTGKPRVAPLMQRPAIELCARKVASATGDLRKALDICRQTIEMVEMETKKKERLEKSPQNVLVPLSKSRLANLENQTAGGADPTLLLRRSSSSSSSESGSMSPSSRALSGGAEGVTLQEAPKVTVEHVKKALASAFGSPLVQKMKALNLHQKIVLAVLVVKIQSGKTVDCEVGKVFDHYMGMCRSSNKIGAVNRGEYQDLINILEASGLITLTVNKKGQEERLRKIGLVPRESEVLEAIKGQDILDTILLKAGGLKADL